MICVRLQGHSFTYPVSDVLRLFYGNAKQISNNEIMVEEPENYLIHSLLEDGQMRTWLEGREETSMIVSDGTGLPFNREVKRQLYRLLSDLTGRQYPWGSLTGIRPTLVAAQTPSAELLHQRYFVRKDKAELAVMTWGFEQEVLDAVAPEALSAYVGIPFCKSRCSYCSFIAQDATRQLDLLDEYKEAVIKEIATFMTDQPRDFRSLYIGGGTPTVFSDDSFIEFMEKIFSLLDASKIPEITVEAGRADTISKAKLDCLKSLGVQRICINPQTLHDTTLSRIGRNHSRFDFYTAYHLARQIGFETINTDLIAGLPEETTADFIYSLEGILELVPENLTIHTLSQKRTAHLNQSDFSGRAHQLDSSIDQMLEYAHRRLQETGYFPYYLYRQKDTLGGHENTGYTKTGHACAYNVAMMSDQRSVVAFGCGSISKRVFSNDRLERCPNLKNPGEYIRRVEEMAQKKVIFFTEAD